MTFTPIDKETWPRREYFDHYVTRNPCTYSMTVRLDVTNIKKRGLRLYPALLYALATVVNRHQEFRYSIREGVLGFYDRLEPSYAVFHKEDETFSLLWTPYDPPSWPLTRPTWPGTGTIRGSGASRGRPRTASTCPCSPGPALRAST